LDTLVKTLDNEKSACRNLEVKRLAVEREISSLEGRAALLDSENVLLAGTGLAVKTAICRLLDSCHRCVKDEAQVAEVVAVLSRYFGSVLQESEVKSVKAREAARLAEKVLAKVSLGLEGNVFSNWRSEKSKLLEELRCIGVVPTSGSISTDGSILMNVEWSGSSVAHDADEKGFSLGVLEPVVYLGRVLKARASLLQSVVVGKTYTERLRSEIIKNL